MTRRGLALLSLVLWFPAACGDTGTGAGTVSSQATEVSTRGTTSTAIETTTATTSTIAPTTTAATTTGDWITLLAAVPDTEQTRQFVVINDYAKARQLLRIDAPNAASGSGAVTEYLLTLALGPVADTSTTPPTRRPPMGIQDSSFGTRAPYDVEAWETAIGFSVLDVKRTLLAGFPPAELTVWQGSIEAEAVGDAVATDPAWSSDLRTIETGDGTYFAWGDDPAAVDVDRADAVRPLGRGGCLHAGDGIAMRAVVCEVLEGALSAVDGSGRSLADVEPFKVLAEALEAADAYAGFLTTDVGVFAVGAMPDLTEGTQASTEVDPLLPYTAAATGVTVDGDASVLLIALLHGNPDDAIANAARLRQVVAEGVSGSAGEPWSDLLNVSDTSVDGPLLLARLETTGPGNLWYRLVAMRDTLLAWE